MHRYTHIHIESTHILCVNIYIYIYTDILPILYVRGWFRTNQSRFLTHLASGYLMVPIVPSGAVELTLFREPEGPMPEAGTSEEWSETTGEFRPEDKVKNDG